MNIKEQIRIALKEIAIGVEDRELVDELELAELGIDSLKYVELLVIIEENCHVLFDESDVGMNNLRCIGDLAALIEKVLPQQVN
jgi:acyl carrier protein